MVRGERQWSTSLEWAVSCSHLSRVSIDPFEKISLRPGLQKGSTSVHSKMTTIILHLQESLCKILKKTPSAAPTPALDKPVIQNCREFCNNTLDARIMRENNQDIIKCIKALQANDSLLRLISIVTICFIAHISLDLEEGLRPVVGVCIKESGDARRHRLREWPPGRGS